ncbi:hypothetical protein BDZ89DRAFT_1076063, partial [Hymenopellis radicata]
IAPSSWPTPPWSSRFAGLVLLSPFAASCSCCSSISLWISESLYKMHTSSFCAVFSCAL